MPSLVLPELLSRAETSRTDVDAVVRLTHWVGTFYADTVRQVASTRVARVLVTGFVHWNMKSGSPDPSNSGALYARIMSSVRAGFRWVMVIVRC